MLLPHAICRKHTQTDGLPSFTYAVHGWDFLRFAFIHPPLYILTRPFGAALGDMLTQAKAYGGLGMDTLWISALFLTVIVMLVAFAQFNMASRIDAQQAK